MEKARQINAEKSEATTAEEAEVVKKDETNEAKEAAKGKGMMEKKAGVTAVTNSSVPLQPLSNRQASDFDSTIRQRKSQAQAAINTQGVKSELEGQEVDDPKSQSLVSSFVPGHGLPPTKEVSVETEKLKGGVAKEREMKAKTYSNHGLGNVEKTAEWTLLITSLLLEGISAISEQLGYGLTAMVMAFLGLLLSIIDLIRKARKEGITGDRGSLLPCFFRHSSHNSPNCKPFGSLVEYFGLACAIWQCFFSTMQYYYNRQNLGNPIKMCLLPFIFALCVVISKLVKRSPRELSAEP